MIFQVAPYQQHGKIVRREVDMFSSRSARVALIVFFFMFAMRSVAQQLTTPQGVRILQNKTIDDSEAARKEILELYKDVRLCDVADGMDLIGLQDIGLMENDIRPLWRDTENDTHRFVGFAVTVRHVPTDVRVGQNSFPDIAGFKKLRISNMGERRMPGYRWSVRETWQ